MIIILTFQVENWELKKVSLPELVALLVSPGLSWDSLMSYETPQSYDGIKVRWKCTADVYVHNNNR